MSTKIHDLASYLVLGAGLAPQTITTSTNGPAADLLAGDGPCFAVQQVGNVSGSSPSLTGKIQESDNGSSWTDIAGATFTPVTSAGNYQTITFERSKRYVRYVSTVSGTGPSFAVAVFVSQQKKVV